MEPKHPAPYAEWNWFIWSAGRSWGWHSHDYLQSIHIRTGMLEADWGEGWEPCSPGSLHILLPGERHRIRTTSGYSQFGINWSPLNDERCLLKALISCIGQSGQWHAPDLLDLVEPLRDPPTEELMDTAIWGHTLDSYALGIYRLIKGDRRTLWSRLVDYMSDNIHRAIQVEETARALGCSRSHLQRICKEHCGQGLAHEHARRRMNAIKRHLASGDIAIGDCAHRFGFEDPTHFCRSFKRMTGVTATEFRRRSQSEM